MASELKHDAYDRFITAYLGCYFATDGFGSLDGGVSFISPPQGQKSFVGGMGRKLFYDTRGLAVVSLQLRKVGPDYLKFLSAGEISSELTRFLTSNFWCFGILSLVDFDGSLARACSAEQRTQFANEFRLSDLMSPSQQTTLFPLSTVKVSTPIQCDLFAITNSHFDGVGALLSDEIVSCLRSTNDDVVSTIVSDQRISGWLVVQSSHLSEALILRSAILGCIATLQSHSARYKFNNLEVPGGHIQITDGRVNISFAEQHTPSLLRQIELDEKTASQLHALTISIKGDTKAKNRRLNCLSYFFRAWFLNEPERFPILCMALESLSSEFGTETNQIISFVTSLAGDSFDDSRLRKLLGLRGAVIHGGAPGVYESTKYEKYVACYRTDPIVDLEVIVATCIELVVLGRQDVFQTLVAREWYECSS